MSNVFFAKSEVTGYDQIIFRKSEVTGYDLIFFPQKMNLWVIIDMQLSKSVIC